MNSAISFSSINDLAVAVRDAPLALNGAKFPRGRIESPNVGKMPFCIRSQSNKKNKKCASPFCTRVHVHRADGASHNENHVGVSERNVICGRKLFPSLGCLGDFEELGHTGRSLIGAVDGTVAATFIHPHAGRSRSVVDARGDVGHVAWEKSDARGQRRSDGGEKAESDSRKEKKTPLLPPAPTPHEEASGSPATLAS